MLLPCRVRRAGIICEDIELPLALVRTTVPVFDRVNVPQVALSMPLQEQVTLMLGRSPTAPTLNLELTARCPVGKWN